MQLQSNSNEWSENVIIVNGDYVDSVAFNLIVNFERMIGRRIPPADFAQWIDCVALDGGLRPGNNQTMVVILHDEQSQCLQNFKPGHYSKELCDKAFRDAMGEFALSAFPIPTEISVNGVVRDAAVQACSTPNVKRVMVVPSPDEFESLRSSLRRIDTADKHVTIFAMEPMPTGNYRQEILGYSLTCALGVKSEEINPQ